MQRLDRGLGPCIQTNRKTGHQSIELAPRFKNLLSWSLRKVQGYPNNWLFPP